MKTFKRVALVVLAGIIGFGFYYLSPRLPILSGYGAKAMCSCVFVAGRTPDDVIQKELGRSPLSLGSFSVNYTDSSASGSVLGLARKKAIYRKGFGCTLLSELSEAEVRAQHLTKVITPVMKNDTLAWPNGEFISKPVPDFIDYAQINKTLVNAFAEAGDKPRRNLRAAIVLYDGQIIAERYAKGFDQQSRHHGWSMTKSITNALVGILVGQGKLKTDEAAPVPGWKNDDRKNITLNNLLQATSGLHWWENYANPSEATKMLFQKKDMGLFTEEQPKEFEPGKKFAYSSGTPNVISRIIRDRVGDEEYYTLPYKMLFHKIGMYSAVIEPDAGGSFVSSSYSFATARDWARFGLLYLNDGVWNNERILPEGWVKYTTTPSSAAPIGEYGALFWLNAGEPGKPSNRRYPDAPTDLFGADGFEGQNIWIIPSKKLVIVRLSQESGNYLDENNFIADIVKAVHEPKK